MAVNLHTTKYRFGIDELAESTHGWYAAENTNPEGNTIGVNRTFLLRFNVQETGGTAAGNTDCQFRVSKNGGAFQDITTSSSIVKAVDPAAWADAANCTQRLTGTGTFETSAAGCTIDGLSGGATNDIAASGCSETECGLQVVSADVVAGDVLTFALTSPDFTITNDIVPTLTFVATPETSRKNDGLDLPDQYLKQSLQSRKETILSFALNLLQSTLAPAAAVANQLRGALFSNPGRLLWRRPAEFVVQALLLTTLAVVVADKPPVNVLWPNPPQQQRKTELLTWVNQPLHSSPLTQYDWQNTRRLGGCREGYTHSLLPLEAPGPVGGLQGTDYPNPRGLARGQGFTDTLLPVRVPTVEDRPVVQTSWPVPRAARAQVQTFVGRVAGVPVAEAQTPPPFVYDYTNPRRPALSRGFSHTLLPSTTPVSQTPSPFVYDYPNPRSPARSVRLLTFLQGPGGAIPDPPPPFEPLFPAPLRPRRGTDWIYPTPLNIVTPVPASVPHPRLEWANPRYVRRISSLLTWTNVPEPQIFVPQVLQTEWPNPRAATRQPNTWVHYAPLTLGYPAAATPLPQGTGFDFPNPKRPARVVNLLTFVDRVKGEPGAAEAVFPSGKQLDWVVPRALPRAIGLRTWINRSLTESQSPPYLQTDWPVPKGPRRVEGFVKGTSAPFVIPLFDRPFNQYEWPLPQRKRKVDGFEKGLPSPFTIPLFDKPFLQSEWPNVKVTRQTGHNVGFTASNPTLLGAPAPIVQTSWPLPPARPGQVRFDWNTNQTQIISPVPAAPFVQTSWPLAPARAGQLRTDQAITGNPTLTLSPIPPVPPIREATWPVPQRAPRNPTLKVGWIDSNPIVNPPPTPPVIDYYDIWHYYTGI